MVNFTEIIAKEIAEKLNMNIEEIEGYIEIPSNKEMGDYSFPCFRLAKSLKKAPQMIATELKEKLQFNEMQIEKIEVINGYLNFFINPVLLTKTVFEEMEIKKEKYGSSDIGKGKNIVIDYS